MSASTRGSWGAGAIFGSAPAGQTSRAAIIAAVIADRAVLRTGLRQEGDRRSTVMSMSVVSMSKVLLGCTEPVDWPATLNGAQPRSDADAAGGRPGAASGIGRGRGARSSIGGVVAVVAITAPFYRGGRLRRVCRSVKCRVGNRAPGQHKKC